MMHTLPFSQLPGSSALLLDFLVHKEFIASRFPPELSLPESQYNRPALVEAIRSTMKGMPLGTHQQEHLEALLHSQTFVVVTGQQAGLFGGPLYTLLKAWSAVHFAEQQETLFPGSKIVPIFWVEDNDHDIEEIASTVVLNNDYNPVELSLNIRREEERMPVSDRLFDETVRETVNHLQQALQSTEFTAELVELIERLYTPGTSLSSAFTTLMNWMLAETGILFVSGAVLQKQGMFAPIVQQELAAPGRTYQTIEYISSLLKEHGYHTQASAQSINLFLIEQGKRYRVQLQDNGIYEAGGSVYTLEQLQDIAQNTPERFSPNVLLRPIVQDRLFPTLAYIAGPGEIAYAAQLKEVYEQFGVQMPLYLLRHSATLTERKFERFTSEHALELSDFYQPYEAVEKKVVAKIGDAVLDGLFTAAEQKIREAFATLRDPIIVLDATLEGTLGRAETQALQQCDMLRSKAVKAQKRNESAVLLKLKQAHTLFYPQHKLQERTVAWIYFCNKFGKSTFQRMLADLVQQPTEEHRIVDVASMIVTLDQKGKTEHATQ